MDEVLRDKIRAAFLHRCTIFVKSFPCFIVGSVNKGYGMSIRKRAAQVMSKERSNSSESNNMESHVIAKLVLVSCNFFSRLVLLRTIK